MTDKMTEKPLLESKEVAIERFQDRAPEAIPEESQSMVMVAMQKGCSPELIEKMMDLQERNEQNIAKKAYVKAIAEFKKNAPVVHKDKENTHFKSTYASKGAIVNTIAPAMAEWGLTHRWEINQPDGQVEVSCILTHEMGHSESSTMKGPPDTSGGGSKNPIQQIKSTRTYLQVATFEDVTGTASSDDSDDDGNSAAGPPDSITEEQLANINTMVTDLIAAKKIKNDADFTARLKRLFKQDSVEKLTTVEADTLIAKLNIIFKSVPEPGDEG